MVPHWPYCRIHVVIWVCHVRKLVWTVRINCARAFKGAVQKGRGMWAGGVWAGGRTRSSDGVALRLD